MEDLDDKKVCTYTIEPVGYGFYVCSACGQTAIVSPKAGDICPTCGCIISSVKQG